MANIKILHIGILDSSSLDEYYDVDIELNNSQVQIDLNFSGKSIDEKRLEIVNHFIENIRIHDLNNKKYIARDFNDPEGDTVRFYIDHHVEELATDDLYELIGTGAKTVDQPVLLLKKLRLVRVGLYPDSEKEFAVFDYSLGKELTNDLVVLFTDENGNLDYMTMES